MGDCFITRRGGGRGHFAALSVSYPAGALLSCTDGVRLLQAGDTSGLWMFSLPAGTWTVTAVDGTRSSSAVVNITQKGQHESLSLSFELVLFEDGEYAAETGGFAGINSGMLLAYAAGSSTAGSVGTAYSKALIDLSGYSRLHFQVVQSESSTTNNQRMLGLCSAVDGGFTKSLSQPTLGQVTLDISDVSGPVGIKLYASCWGSGWAECSLKVSKIWAS